MYIVLQRRLIKELVTGNEEATVHLIKQDYKCTTFLSILSGKSTYYASIIFLAQKHLLFPKLC